MSFSGRGRGRGGREMLPGDQEKYDAYMGKAMEMMQRAKTIATSGCRLPELQKFFSGPEWELSKLAKNRDELNETKNRLDAWDRRKWEAAAAVANPADQVRAKLRDDFHVELGTIAWAKMYETIWCCDMMPCNSPAVRARERGSPGVVSVHLCEAPGAFIAATNHYVKTHRPDWRWDWMAVSLNPYCEANDKAAMIEDDALISATQHKWCFGADNTGDIRRIPNIRAIWERGAALCRSMGCPGGALMVTADGAVDTSMDPNRQELITASLHYCEVVAALGLLAPGGNFVWKGFTLYEHPSICSLYLMGCLFERVLVYKPATSKPANSEVYVIGHNFRGVPRDVLGLLLEHCGEEVFCSSSLFPLELFPPDFLHTACDAAIYFGTATREAIADAIGLDGLPQRALAPLRNAQRTFADWWCAKLQVRPLDRAAFLAPHMEIDGRRNNTSGAKRRGNELTGTLADRQEQFKKRREDQGLPMPREEPPAVPERGFGGLGLGAGGSGTADAAGGGMNVSAAAMAMMAKMGHKDGQGLGRSNQGMAAVLEVEGNRRRAGLGLDQGGGSGGPAGVTPDWSLAPDSAVLGCPGPLTKAEVETWPPLQGAAVPPVPQINKSKMLPDDSVLLALRVARRECCVAAADGGACCRHVKHCLAPRRLGHASRAFWKLAAVDSALEVCRAACEAALRNKATPRALDLSLLGGAGATEYLTSGGGAAGRPPRDWRVTVLATARARAFIATSLPAGNLTSGPDPRVHLYPLPPFASSSSLEEEESPSPSPLEVCTAGSSCALAEAVPGCWLVVGDLGSLRRLQDTRLGVLEGELSPAYRRAMLWEAATALGCLAPGGCAVLRLGSCLTFFTAGVLYLLHRSFAQVAVVKPFASCAASSERLLVAMGCLDDVALPRRRLLEALAEVERVEITAPPPPSLDGCSAAAAAGPLPAAQLHELVPAGVLVRCPDFLRYMDRRTTALAEREAAHCRAAVAAVAAGEPPPSEEELEELGRQAEGVLEAGAPPPPASASGTPAIGFGDLYGGMFTRGGLGSDLSGAGAAAEGTHRPPPPHPSHHQQPPLLPHGQQKQVSQHQHQQRHSQQQVWGGGAAAAGWSAGGPGGGGAGGPPAGPPQTLVFNMLSRNAQGDEFVCRMRCEATADVAARARLDSADSAVARYALRDDFEPQRHFRTSLPLLPDSPEDATRLGRLMEFMANSRKPGGREKVVLLTPLTADDGAGGDGANGHGNGNGGRKWVCVSLTGRDAVNPKMDGLMLWC